MAEPNWPRHVGRIGAFEFRRTVRSLWQDKARFALTSLGILVPSAMFAAFIYFFADVIRGQGAVALPNGVRGTVALFWLFGAFLVAQRVVSARPRVDAEPLMLTTVSARTVAGGLVVAEALRVLAYLGLPALTLTAGLVYLFGSVASILVVPLAAVLLAVTAVVVGTVVGYAIALLVATSPFVARHKTVLGTVATLGAMGAYFLVMLADVGGVDEAALAWLPAGWLADLAAVGTPVGGSLPRAVGSLVAGLALVVIGGALAEREATALWFTEPVSPDDNREAIEEDERSPASAEPQSSALAAAIRPLGVPSGLARPTRRVAEWTVLRTRRDPRRLNFLLIPVVGIGSGLFNIGLQSGSLPSLLAPACAAVLPWVAGAVFAMNPFGDEGAVLPVALLSTDGAAYVRGLMVPGLAFGLPVVVVATAAAAAFAPYALAARLGLVAVAAFVTVVAVATAPAVGMRFPRFSAISIGQSREVIPPRLLPTALHFAATVLPGAFLALLVVDPDLARTVAAGLFGGVPAVLLRLLAGSDGGAPADAADWFGGVATQLRSVPVETLQVASGVLLVVGGFAAAMAAYRLAVNRFETYSPPA